MYKINAEHFDYMLLNNRDVSLIDETEYQKENSLICQILNDLCDDKEKRPNFSYPLLLVKENGRIDKDIDIKSIPSKIIINNVKRDFYELYIKNSNNIEDIILYNKYGYKIESEKEYVDLRNSPLLMKYKCYFLEKGTYVLKFKLGYADKKDYEKIEVDKSISLESPFSDEYDYFDNNFESSYYEDDDNIMYYGDDDDDFYLDDEKFEKKINELPLRYCEIKIALEIL